MTHEDGLPTSSGEGASAHDHAEQLAAVSGEPGAPAAVLTVSDGVAAGTREDRSGDALVEALRSAGYAVTSREVVADEPEQVREALRRLVGTARLIVTTGGTGLGPRDVTPEATAAVIDREVPGLAEAMRAAGRASTPMADLSRGRAGAVDTSLVLNLPGSPRGALQSLQTVQAALSHALELLAGHTAHSGEHEGANHAERRHAHASEHGHPRAHTHGASATAGPAPAAHTASSGRAGLHGELARRVGRGEPVVLATAVSLEGAPPCDAGAAVLLDRSGPVSGSLGCAEFDDAAGGDAQAALTDGVPILRRYDHELGSVEVQLQPFHPAPLLAVVGATPVADCLLRWAGELGWTPVLVESRRERLTDDRFAAAGTVVEHPLELALDGRAVGVHTDHDAPNVADQIAALLHGGVRRIELVGSRRHTSPILERLTQLGIGPDERARVHQPAGLDLGGRQPGEVALAILAGLVAERHGRSATFLDVRAEEVQEL